MLLTRRLRTFTATHSRMAAAAQGGKFSFSIDRGGTFTDVYAATPKGAACLAGLLLQRGEIRRAFISQLVGVSCGLHRSIAYDALSLFRSQTDDEPTHRLPGAEAAVGGPHQLPGCAARGALQSGCRARAICRSSTPLTGRPPINPQGIRRILEQETGIPHPRNKPLDTSRYVA